EQAIFAHAARVPDVDNIRELKAMLGEYLEDRSVLRVLRRPDREELIRRSRWPEPVKQVLLSSHNNPHTLGATTYAEKLQRVRDSQREARSWLPIGWAVLFFACVVWIIIWFRA